MPIPPTNISPATAYDLTGLLPFSDTINMSGLTNPQKVWFKFILSGQFAFSAWMQNDNDSLSNYRSRIKYYLGLPADPNVGILQNGTEVIEFFIEESIGVPKAGTIYISVENTYPSTATPTIPLTFKFQSIPNITAVSGSIFISNDVDNYPSTIVPPTGTPVQIRSFVPNGESAAILNNGNSLWAVAASGGDYTQLAVFDADFEIVTTLSWSFRTQFRDAISSNRVDTYYISATASGKIASISAAGVVGTVWTIPMAGSPLYFMHPSMLNNDIIYVKTWDGICKFHKSTGILDAAFIPYDLGVHPARWAMYGYYGEEFVVMDDDTIVCLYSANGTNTDKRGKIIYYSTSGAVLAERMQDFEDVNRIAFGTLAGAVATIPVRTVWAWTYTETFKSQFIQWDLLGNIKITEFTRNTTSSGYTFTEEDVPAGMFGIPESCPLIIVPPLLPPYGDGVIPPEPPSVATSGIYFINPIKATKHDSYYTAEMKIPNPTIKTSLIGE